jgi:amino acid adenylation domain-containing protein
MAPQRSAQPPMAAGSRYPLTHVQKGMLFQGALDAGSGVNVQQVVLTFPNGVDTPAFERGFRQVVERHPALRASFRWESVDGLSVQVAPSVTIAIQRHDFRTSDGRDSERRLEQFLNEDRRRSFNTETAPLMRLALFSFPDGRDRVVWSFHHALLDGPSVDAVLGEILRAYEEPAPNFGSEPAAFDDYARWLAQRDTRASETFWREYLRGFAAPTPLPGARLRGNDVTDAQKHVRIAVPHHLSAALRQFSSAHGVGLDTLILAAWGLVLSRHSGESDVLFGVARPLRPGEFSATVGLCINTIVQRVRVPAGTPVLSWLQQLQLERDLLSAHEHAPLMSIQKWSSVPPGTPLFDNMVVFDQRELSSNALCDVQLHERTAYALTLTAYTADRLSFKMAWDDNRVDEAIVRYLPGHLLTLLEAFTASTDAVQRLPMLTAEERDTILSRWNDTARHYSRDVPIHKLFEAQVERVPDRLALRFEGQQLTYAELNARANRIASHLRRLGVGRNTLVAILVERSPHMIAALLGILKAGGAYVPLDRTYPLQRLEFMVEDARPPFLVTETALRKLLAAPGATVVNADDDFANESPDNLPSITAPEDLAYVIYTSGSTGKPKGVELPHRAVVNFLETMRERPGLTESDVVLGLTTLSFDIAGLEIYLPLTTGATLELLSREVAADGRRLAEAIERSGATVVQATPATWRMLLETGWRGGPHLKLLCGGEAMSGDLGRELLARCGSLWNMYGPTETTIWSTVNHVTEVNGATAPIGRPIANTTIYVLDESGEPVPIGAPGELHIGGEGLARGYLNRPELTAQRFIEHPIGGRLYKTGDAARYLGDGGIEYLNRLDNQVKLRGYRIELGEIEETIRRHDRVADAVVVATDMPGGKALAAYVIAANPPAPPANELRELLRGSLPEYMVPSFFVEVAEFPLTPNGKVDRKALPKPQTVGSTAPQERVAPRDEIEQKLAAIWSEVLGVESIGVQDNFFELGGESLLALRMFLKVEEAFQRQLPLATLIHAPTIESLAGALRDDAATAEAAWSPLVPIQATGTKTPFFCVHGVGGNVLNYRPMAMYLGEDQPFYGLQAVGLDGKQQPLTRIEDMAALYVEHIRTIQPHGPYLLGGASFGGVVAFEMARQLREAGEKISLVALFDTTPVNYARLLGRLGETTLSGSLSRRMKVHVDVLRRGPNRTVYFYKKVRRVYRKVVYRTWQTIYKVFEKRGAALPQYLQNVQQANYKALADYLPHVYDGEVVLFAAELEPAEFTKDKQVGWRTLATAGVKVIDVPGDHLSMVEEPHVATLAARLRACIEGEPAAVTTTASLVSATMLLEFCDALIMASSL